MFRFTVNARRLTAVATLIVLGIVSLPGLSSPRVTASATPTLGWIQWTNPGSFVLTATKPVISGTYNYAPEALGQLQLPGGSLVYVKFEGEVIEPTGTGNDQPSAFGASGSGYWSTLGGTGGIHFTSESVPTLPPNSDRIAVSGNQAAGGRAQQRLSFYSDANRTTPVNVSNIVMLFRSLGQTGLTSAWDFDNDFAILSSGLGGSGSGRILPSRTPLSGGARLSGAEANGSLQFTGTFSSISWTVTAPEFFAVWNVGATSAAPPGVGATLTPSQTTVNGAVGTAIADVGMTPARLGGTVTYSYTGVLPPGLNFNTATGAITGTPTTVGNYSIVVTATGAAWGTATSTVNFTVAATSTSTTSTSTPPTTAPPSTTVPPTTVPPATTVPPMTTVPPTTTGPMITKADALPTTGGLTDMLLALSAALLASGVYLANVRRRTAPR